MDLFTTGALIVTPVISAVSSFVGASVRLARTEARVDAHDTAIQNLTTDVREVRAQVTHLPARPA